MEVKHRGYTAVQDAESNHIHIFSAGASVCHAIADGRATEEEMREVIDCYLEITRGRGETN